MRGEMPRKIVAAEIGVFALPQVGQRIEPPELGVHQARMAHDEAIVGEAFEKTRKQRGNKRAESPIYHVTNDRCG